MEDQKTRMSGTQWFMLGWLIVAVSVMIAGLNESIMVITAIGGIMTVAALFIGRKTEN